MQQSSRSINLQIALSIAILNLVAFWPVVHADFINYDDPYYVFQNPHIQKGFTSESLRWAFTTKYASNWHPLTWISHMLDYQLFGLNPHWHHFINLLIHLFNGELVFLVFSQMTKRTWESAILAALFAIHPLHVESVAWIAERKDLLSTFFGLISLFYYFRFTIKKSALNYCLVTAFFGLSLMSKPMLVTLPFLFLLLDIWPLSRLIFGVRFLGWTTRTLISARSSAQVSPKIAIFEKIPWFIMAVFSSIVTLWAQSEAMFSSIQLPFFVRLANASVTYARYVKKAVWPGHLVVLYPMAPTLSLLEVIAALAMMIIIFWVILRYNRAHPYLLVGWLWFMGSLVPAIGLVQVGVQCMADRYTYFPLLGLFLAFIWFVSDKFMERLSALVPFVATSLCLLCFALVTRRQLSFWQDSIALFRHAVAFTSNNSICLYNLGISQMDNGNLAEAERNLQLSVGINPKNADSQNGIGKALLLENQPEAALVHLHSALDLEPQNPVFNHNLALGFIAAGKLTEAAEQLEHTLTRFPNYLLPHKDLSLVLFELKKFQQARDHVLLYLRAYPKDAQGYVLLGDLYAEEGNRADSQTAFQQALTLEPTLDIQLRRAAEELQKAGNQQGATRCFKTLLHLRPEDSDSFAEFGKFLAGCGRMQEAITNFQAACRLRPDALAYYNLALIYSLGNDRGAAIGAYQEAIRLNPNWDAALNDLSWLLATSPEKDLRNGEEAIFLAQKACELNPREARYWGTLDAAYAEAGKFGDAMRIAEKAMGMAQSAGQQEVADAAGNRLKLYRAGKQFHQTVDEN